MPSCRPASRNALALLSGQRATPLIMGVVNVTPDSFYPASRASSTAEAVSIGLKMVRDGAHLLDIGGQSTRPGSEPVPLDEELARVIPVLRALAEKTDVPLSIDTDKAAVARAAREAGAAILNDVSAFRSDRFLVEEARSFEAVVLMHRGGDSPKTMQDSPAYGDVVAEVSAFLRERVAFFEKNGGEPSRVLVDPGIGFGKDLAHNLSLLKRLGELSRLAPVVLGASRKSFLGKLSPDAGPEDRLPGSLAAAAWAARCGARVVRVHDVAATRKVFDVWAGIEGAS